MNAKEAARESQKAKKRIEEEKRREIVRKDNLLKEKITRALEVELPLVIREIDKEILKSVQKGEISVRRTYNNDSPVSVAIYRSVREYFEKKGFKLHSEHSYGSDNMGDFNYPCMVHYDNTILSISW